MKLRTKVLLLLVATVVAVGANNGFNMELVPGNNKSTLQRVARGLRNDGADIEIVEELPSCTIYACEHVNGLLLQTVETHMEVYLYRINNAKELENTIAAYERYNEAYRSTGGFVKLYNVGEYLLVVDAAFDREEFEKYCKRLDDVINLMEQKSPSY